MNDESKSTNIEVFNSNGQIQLFDADSMVIDNGCSNGWSMTVSDNILFTGNVTGISGAVITDGIMKPADTQQPSTRRVVTIRHNMDYNDDTVEVLDGTTQLGLYTDKEFNAVRLAEILRWFGHPVRLVDYMFEHDIAEFG